MINEYRSSFIKLNKIKKQLGLSESLGDADRFKQIQKRILYLYMVGNEFQAPKKTSSNFNKREYIEDDILFKQEKDLMLLT